LNDADTILTDLKSWKEKVKTEEERLCAQSNIPTNSTSTEVTTIDDQYESSIETMLKTSMKTNNQVCQNFKQHIFTKMEPITLPTAVISQDQTPINIKNKIKLTLVSTQHDISVVKKETKDKEDDIESFKDDLNLGADLGEDILGYTNELEELLQEIEDDLD